MRDIEGKAAPVAVSECGQRANFNWARLAWNVELEFVAIGYFFGRVGESG